LERGAVRQSAIGCVALEQQQEDEERSHHNYLIILVKKKAENRFLTVAAQNRHQAFIAAYRTATVRESVAHKFFNNF